MISRREVVTGGLVGTLATAATAAPAEAGQSLESVVLERGLSAIRQQLEQIKVVLDDSLRQNSLSHGQIVPVRRAFELFLRTTGKFPDFLEVGSAVFLEIYDWHVRHNQPIELTRTADGRMVLQFMFTQLILRHEQDPIFIGPPYDRP